MTENKYLVPTGLLFLILILLSILLGEMTNYFLDLNQLVYKDLSEKLTVEQIEKIFSFQERWKWLNYILLPLLMILKITAISWILGIGCFLYSINLEQKSLFRVVVISEFIFLLPALGKILWFCFVQTDFSLNEVQAFVPLSMQNLIDTSEMPNWSLYPLQIMNLVEVIYCFLLAYLINNRTSAIKGMKIVLTTYVPALMIWTIFIMFLSLNMGI